MTYIYVLDDGKTWTLEKPVEVRVTQEQLDRIEGGEPIYSVVDAADIMPDCPACSGGE